MLPLRSSKLLSRWLLKGNPPPKAKFERPQTFHFSDFPWGKAHAVVLVDMVE